MIILVNRVKQYRVSPPLVAIIAARHRSFLFAMRCRRSTMRRAIVVLGVVVIPEMLANGTKVFRIMPLKISPVRYRSGNTRGDWDHCEKLPRHVPNHHQLGSYKSGTFAGSAHQVNEVPKAVIRPEIALCRMPSRASASTSWDTIGTISEDEGKICNC